MRQFEQDKTFQTFEVFPEFKMISKQNFIKEDVSDVKGTAFEKYFSNNSLATVCVENDNKNVGYGQYFHLINNFG